MDANMERALQHAISQANSAFATGVPSPDIDAPRKKEKKRTRQDTADDGNLKKGKKKKTSGLRLEESRDLPTSVNEVTGLVENVKGTKKRTGAKASTPSHLEGSTSTGTGMDLSSLRVDPSLLSSPVQASAFMSVLTSTTGLPASQVTQDMYYPQNVPPFPSINPEDHSTPQFNSNDDILHAFQDLDLAHLAGVFPSLDGPVSPPPSNAQQEGAFQGDANSFLPEDILSAVSNIEKTTLPSGSHATSGNSGPSKKKPKKTWKSIPQPTSDLPTVGPSIDSSGHNHLLATKWLSSSKLKALVETEGLVYKKGKFSAIEEQALKTAIENYRVNNALSTEEITEVIFSKSKEEGSFWPEITASVPGRPITAVYHHVRRTHHPLKNQGKWSEEEDTALIQAIADDGQAWQKVSVRVGRTAQDCRDRWKNHVAHRALRHRGHWTKEEEEELTGIVLELTAKQAKSLDNEIFWGVVSQRMGNKRGRQQCRLKWTDSLSKTVKNSGNMPRWNKLDSFILVHKVASLDVRDDSEIDWNILRDADWNLWSAHCMQRRWRSLKLSITGHESMAFRGLVEILQQQYSELPSIKEDRPTGKKPASRKEPKSAELIEEGEEEAQPVEH